MGPCSSLVSLACLAKVMRPDRWREGLFSPGIAAGWCRHFSDKPTIRPCDNKRSFPGVYHRPESC
jgi:hypothetical protein